MTGGQPQAFAREAMFSLSFDKIPASPQLEEWNAMKMMVSLLAALTLLSGCAVYTPNGAIVLDPVGTVNQRSGGGGGGFCPPGQAKKGNC